MMDRSVAMDGWFTLRTYVSQSSRNNYLLLPKALLPHLLEGTSDIGCGAVFNHVGLLPGVLNLEGNSCESVTYRKTCNKPHVG